MQQYTLKHPIKTAAGQSITTLELRRAKVKDIKAAHRFSDKESEQEIALLALLCTPALTPEDMEELDVADYRALQATFRDMVAE